MKVKRLRLVLVVVALVSIIATYNALAWKQEPSRDATNRNQLRSLLSTVGVSVGESQPEVSPDHRKLTVHWESGLSPTKTLLNEQPKSPGVLTLTDSTTRPGSALNPRTLELSTTHILAIAIDDAQQLVWWNQFPDPRIVRAEVPDANGRQHLGRTLYLSETDFTVAYPNSPAIRELRFYQPLWTSKGFELQLIGSVLLK
jgi:hypothetical protein